MKLDGDIELDAELFARADGALCRRPAARIWQAACSSSRLPDGWRTIEIPRHHVHGALKCYSRECFEAIGGVQERLGWDTIDETYARMRGFVTVSFDDLVSIHHRPWGSADGAIRGLTRLGECAYITHYPPLWVLLRSVKLGLARRQGA